MADRSVRRASRALVAGCWLLSSAVWLSGASANGDAAGSAISHAAQSGVPVGATLRELQFNLCDSGIAGCYSGRSVDVAGAVIREERPDVVTLNEVCRDDVAALAGALSDARHGYVVASAFEPAVDRRTGGPFRCLNGQAYGIGVLAVVAGRERRYRTYAGRYRVQNPVDPEERVWVCIDLPGALLACTTHSASTSSAVALAQCRFLLDSALPALRRRTGAPAVLVGADLNLRAHGVPSSRSCAPRGYQRVDDGALQDVIANAAVVLRSHADIGMRRTTDHPALLVDFTVLAG